MQIVSSTRLFKFLEDNAQDEERAVCDCLNPFDVIAVALARHLLIGALFILGDVPEVRGDIVEVTGRKSLNGIGKSVVLLKMV